LPHSLSLSYSTAEEFSCFITRSVVSGMNGARRETPVEMPSVRLYSTSERRAFCDSSLASFHGSVSSMYLLQRLKRLKISVIASATRSSSILAVTAATVPVTHSLRLASVSLSCPISPVCVTTPPKYLLLIAMVRFTRLPSVFASSEFMRSTMRSQEMTPSFSNGISCRQK